MSAWEISPTFFQVGDFVFPLLLDDENGMVQHLANPMLMAMEQRRASLCDERELTHVAVMSREPVTQCAACLEQLKRLPNV